MKRINEVLRTMWVVEWERHGGVQTRPILDVLERNHRTMMDGGEIRHAMLGMFARFEDAAEAATEVRRELRAKGQEGIHHEGHEEARRKNKVEGGNDEVSNAGETGAEGSQGTASAA